MNLLYKKEMKITRYPDGGMSGETVMVPRFRMPAVKWMATREKRFRLDVKLWEQEHSLAFIKWYVYSVHDGVKLRSFWKLRRLKDAVYFHFKPFPPLEITQAEVDKLYGGNKYMVPLNLKIVA